MVLSEGDPMNRPHLKILVVDETAQNLLAMQGLLGDDGIEVLTADSGTSALETLLRHDVALALIDVNMPGMDGYTLAELMRGTERTSHVPIIFLTAGGAEEARSFRGYEAGAVDFLYKPLDPRVLRSKVQVFCDLHRQRLLLAQRVADHERLQRLSATMLSALSHDIRTPLTVMALNAELLVRTGGVVGQRIKAATTMLGRQLDHLVNLAQLPSDEIRPQLQPGRVDELVRERLDTPANRVLVERPFEFTAGGDAQTLFDRALLADAIDRLLLQAATHAGGGAVKVTLDAMGRHALVLRITFGAVLDGAASRHMFGDGVPLENVSTPRVGPGLVLPERIARAHGGSLIGRSKDGEGTLFEMLLPRATLG
jgi:two-component system, sensor histidine kinase and response regulator